MEHARTGCGLQVPAPHYSHDPVGCGEREAQPPHLRGEEEDGDAGVRLELPHTRLHTPQTSLLRPSNNGRVDGRREGPPYECGTD